MKVYVEAQSKAALIRRLSAGEEITGLNYSMFGGGGYYKLDNTLEDGTIIAIYSQMSGGNPVAKSWGTWTNGVLKAETFEAGSGPWGSSYSLSPDEPLTDEEAVWEHYYENLSGDEEIVNQLWVLEGSPQDSSQIWWDSIGIEEIFDKYFNIISQAAQIHWEEGLAEHDNYMMGSREEQARLDELMEQDDYTTLEGTFEGHHGYHAETLMCPICDSVCDHDSQNLYDCSSCEIMWLQHPDGGFDFLEAESIPAGVGVIFK